MVVIELCLDRILIRPRLSLLKALPSVGHYSKLTEPFVCLLVESGEPYLVWVSSLPKLTGSTRLAFLARLSLGQPGGYPNGGRYARD